MSLGGCNKCDEEPGMDCVLNTKIKSKDDAPLICVSANSIDVTGKNEPKCSVFFRTISLKKNYKL